MQKKWLAALIAGLMANSASGQEGVLAVLVEDTSLDDPVQYTVDPRESGAPAADAGAWLRDLTGVSGVRMGGHAIDPVIRGQGQTRLNVLSDGAFVHGGCPNRMDPPTSFIVADSYDRVTVIAGVQTVVHGPGGSGGTVLFERLTPRFSADEHWRGTVAAGASSNGGTRELLGNLAFGGEDGFLRLVGRGAEGGNYRSGDGTEVRAAYREEALDLVLGHTPSEATRLELAVEAKRGKDMLFAGAGMDAPLSEHDAVRLRWETAPGKAVDRLAVNLYHSSVHHLMDNYSLREPSGMLMSVPSDSVTSGGRVAVETVSAAGVMWTFGVDGQRNRREAIRYVQPLGAVNSYLWPDVALEQAGLFGEARADLSGRDALIAGLRYDRFGADAAKAGVAPEGMGQSAEQLYMTYYGVDARQPAQHGWGGVLRWEHGLARHPVMLFSGLGRSIRAGDATERYMAANGIPERRWVGNPALAPERHYQAEVGLAMRRESRALTGSIFYDRVGDYILRDRARAQEGILMDDGATIYRNVAARLYGAELEGRRAWGPWSGSIGMAWVHATNLTDDRPIAQIPPLQASLSLDHTRGALQQGATVRAAARQSRVDADPATGSGLDVGETPGYAVLDLHGAWRFASWGRLQYGVSNVFDRAYADHLNKEDLFGGTVQVQEPGRTLWLKTVLTH